MLLIALGYKYLNRADPDCGTTFAWTTRAFGPWVGWINGWAIFVADVLVMASLSVIAAQYTYLLVRLELGGELDPLGSSIGAVVWIALMTWICYRGIELSARMQLFLLGAEIAILAVFAVVALVKVYADSPRRLDARRALVVQPVRDLVRARSPTACCSGSSSTGAGTPASRSTRSPRTPPRRPGKAAVLSTVLLLLIYVIVSAAAQAYGGTRLLVEQLERRAQRARQRTSSARRGTSC